MGSLGELNSRMKDFFDIWLPLQSFDFEGQDLAEAIRRTFDRRGTELPESITAFAPEFAMAKQVQWRAFTRRLREGADVPDLSTVTSAIAEFLSPIILTIHGAGRCPSGGAVRVRQ